MAGSPIERAGNHNRRPAARMSSARHDDRPEPLDLCQIWVASGHRKGMEMKRSRVTEEQIIAVLREQEGGVKRGDVSAAMRLTAVLRMRVAVCDPPDMASDSLPSARHVQCHAGDVAGPVGGEE